MTFDGDMAARGRALCVRIGAALLLATAVANCAGPQNAVGGLGNKYGVAPSPKVVADGDPVPKGGGREMIGKPYVVGGRTYVPTGGKGFSREGWASWYGAAFHGRLTANGEVFDRGSVAAASPTLPLPSYIRVTNTLNKRSMVVRVNDRGPYEQGRLIDVSERVAEALDFRRRGTARVRVEYLGKASTNGSDDEKLLATLKTDGSPAPYRVAPGATMVADLKAEPAPRPTVLAAAEAPPRTSIVRENEEAEPAVPVAVLPPPRADVAAVQVAVVDVASGADDGVAEMAEIDHPAPPRRPAEFAGPTSSSPVRSMATLELLPPQRPVVAAIY